MINLHINKKMSVPSITIISVIVMLLIILILKPYNLLFAKPFDISNNYVTKTLSENFIIESNKGSSINYCNSDKTIKILVQLENKNVKSIMVFSSEDSFRGNIDYFNSIFSDSQFGGLNFTGRYISNIYNEELKDKNYYTYSPINGSFLVNRVIEDGKNQINISAFYN